MELRFHGSFPPAYQDVPGTIAPKAKAKTEQEPSEYEPLCLLQAWTEERDGKTAYLFLMYALQAPPWVIAKTIARYFRITPAAGDASLYDFIEVTPPNQELLRPVLTRYNFEWEWQTEKWTRRGVSWIWQSAGHGVKFPYSESLLVPSEEEQYTQQLASLMVEAGEQDHQAALPQPKQRFLLPTFTRQHKTVEAIAEKATVSTQS